MSAPFSIVIPTLNAADELPATLNCLLPGLEQGLISEVIISDGGSTDATLKLADDAGAVMVKGAAGRGGQLRRGAEIAKSDWILFLHADTHLPHTWPGALSIHINQSENAAVFKLGFRSVAPMARLTAGWANLRSRVFGLPYGDQGLLISKELYNEIGGFADQPLMEDVAMARALSGRLTVLDEIALTSDTRYAKSGWLKRGTRNLWTLTRYLLGTSPEVLAKAYHKQ